MTRMKMMQLYLWSKPGEMIDTQYGRVSVREWMVREELRITADPTRQAEIRYTHDRMALFVDDGGGRWG